MSASHVPRDNNLSFFARAAVVMRYCTKQAKVCRLVGRGVQ